MKFRKISKQNYSSHLFKILVYLIIFTNIYSTSSLASTLQFLKTNKFKLNSDQASINTISLNLSQRCPGSISSPQKINANLTTTNSEWLYTDPIIKEAIYLSRSIIIPQIIKKGFNTSFKYTNRFYEAEPKQDDILKLINDNKLMQAPNHFFSNDVDYLEILLKLHIFLNDPRQILPLLIELEDKIIAQKLTKINIGLDYTNQLHQYLYDSENKSEAKMFYNKLSVDHKEELDAYKSLIYLFGAKNNIEYFSDPMPSLIEAMSETIFKHFEQNIKNRIPSIEPGYFPDGSKDLSESSGKITMETLKNNFLTQGVFLDYGLITNGLNTHGIYTHLLQAYLTAKFLDLNEIDINGKPVLAKDIYMFLSRPNEEYKVSADQYAQDPWVYIYDVISREGQNTFFYRTFGCPEFIHYFLNELPIFPFLTIK